jgi:hypothetical protein
MATTLKGIIGHDIWGCIPYLKGYNCTISEKVMILFKSRHQLVFQDYTVEYNPLG